MIDRERHVINLQIRQKIAASAAMLTYISTDLESGNPRIDPLRVSTLPDLSVMGNHPARWIRVSTLYKSTVWILP